MLMIVMMIMIYYKEWMAINLLIISRTYPTECNNVKAGAQPAKVLQSFSKDKSPYHSLANKIKFIFHI